MAALSWPERIRDRKPIDKNHADKNTHTHTHTHADTHTHTHTHADDTRTRRPPEENKKIANEQKTKKTYKQNEQT